MYNIFISILIFGFVVYFLFGSDEGIVVFLCVLISLTSFILYMYKDSYTEAFLTFFFGYFNCFYHRMGWIEDRDLPYFVPLIEHDNVHWRIDKIIDEG